MYAASSTSLRTGFHARFVTRLVRAPFLAPVPLSLRQQLHLAIPGATAGLPGRGKRVELTFCRAASDGSLGLRSPRVPALLFDWSEPLVWEEALQAAAGGWGDPAALRRLLAGLHVLLPDLEPHWRELLALHERLIGIEALLRGLAPAALPGAQPAPPAAVMGAGGGSGGGSDPSRDACCLYAEAQQAAQELQSLGAFVRLYGNRATGSCYQHSVWVLTETLMGAARNYCGPGSTLLTAADLQVAATAVQALRRSYEAHLSALIRLQVQLAMRLPEVSVRLVALRTETADAGLDVSRLVATNLGLLADLAGNQPGQGQPRGAERPG